MILIKKFGVLHAIMEETNMNRGLCKVLVVFGIFCCVFVYGVTNYGAKKCTDEQIGKIEISGTLVSNEKGKWAYKLSTEIGDLLLNISWSEEYDRLNGANVRIQGDIIKRLFVIDGVATKKFYNDNKLLQRCEYSKEIYAATNAVIKEIFIDNIAINGKKVKGALTPAVESRVK